MDYLNDHEGVLPFALKQHGITQNFDEAGFVLPDGQMLDFSEGHPGHRARSHENVDIPDNARVGGSKLERMLLAGAARLSATFSEAHGTVGILEVGPHPVPLAMAKTLERFIEHHRGNIELVVTNPTQLERHVEKSYRRETPTHILNDLTRAQRGEDLGEGFIRDEPD
jgi:hypothetical protein